MPRARFHRASPPEGNLLAVDLLRTLAIFAVVASHARAAFPFPEWEPLQKIWNTVSTTGANGVYVFFVVSGFLITRLIDRGPGGLEKPGLRWFYARRAGRILPLWAFAVLFGAFMFTFVDDPKMRYSFCYRNPAASYGPAFWLSLPTLTFNWYTLLPFHGDIGRHWSVMWSLAVEEQFYLLYPWMLRSLGGGRPLVRLLSAVVLLGPLTRAAAAWAFPNVEFLPLLSSFTGFELIAAGALAYLAFRDRGWKAPLPVRLASVLGGAALLAFLFTREMSLPHFGTRLFGPTGIALATTVLLGGLLSLEKPLRAAGAAVLAVPGRLSYGLYLLHITCLYFLHPFLRPLSWGVSVPVYMAATLAVAWVSHRLFEKPANLAIRRAFGHGDVRASG